MVKRQVSGDWRKVLAGRLRTARQAAALSQAQLAVRSGVSDRTISSIEQGKAGNDPKPETIARLAIATGIADPREWLALDPNGAAIGDEGIEALRRVIAAPEEYEPASELRKDYEARIQKLRDDVHELIAARPDLTDIDRKELREHLSEDLESTFRLSERLETIDKVERAFEPAIQLRTDLKRYVDERVAYLDTRIAEFRNLLSDVTARIDNLAAFCRDLSRQNIVSDSTSTKE